MERDQLTAPARRNPYSRSVYLLSIRETDFPLSHGLWGLVCTKVWPLHRGLSPQMQRDACQICHFSMCALEGFISEVNIRGKAPDDVGVGWITHSWALALVNVERLECNVYFPLVLWFEVCIFPLLHRATRCGCIMLQLLWWQPPDLLWTSTPLSSGYLLSLVPLGYVKYLHRQNRTRTQAHRLLPFSQ